MPNPRGGWGTASDVEVLAQIERAEVAIEKVARVSPKPLFRFPYGARDARTLAIVNGAGYGGFRRTVDTLGRHGTSGGSSADTVVQRVLDKECPGQTVLLHVGSHPSDGSTLDADALPRIIDELTHRGCRFVTLLEALVLADG
jgi:peptidoglycan/xylan/chitin deacetylase (PgdA/CDA1 family)